jgi:glycosyltransferase involved in cell wall biosynthesis
LDTAPSVTGHLNVLWIAPNFNHYKARFLRQLHGPEFRLKVLAGRELNKEGHKNLDDQWNYPVEYVSVPKTRFQLSPSVYLKLFEIIKRDQPKVVLVPLEKKYALLIVALWLSKSLKKFRLATYTHPFFKARSQGFRSVNIALTKLFFRFFDRVIFYTQASADWAIGRKLLSAEKARFANNTLDTREIRKRYSFELNQRNPKVILFIGRLVKDKLINVLFDYHELLSRHAPGCRLLIIGDGPMASYVVDRTLCSPNIDWIGALVDEAEIGRYMQIAHLIFVPGASGLSIVHAFCYGKPYVTLARCESHGPELSYISHGVNGLILSGSELEDVAEIAQLLNDKERYAEMCARAYETAERLSVENWCTQVKMALSH